MLKKIGSSCKWQLDQWHKICEALHITIWLKKKEHFTFLNFMRLSFLFCTITENSIHFLNQTFSCSRQLKQGIQNSCLCISLYTRKQPLLWSIFTMSSSLQGCHVKLKWWNSKLQLVVPVRDEISCCRPTVSSNHQLCKGQH